MIVVYLLFVLIGHVGDLRAEKNQVDKFNETFAGDWILTKVESANPLVVDLFDGYELMIKAEGVRLELWRYQVGDYGRFGQVSTYFADGRGEKNTLEYPTGARMVEVSRTRAEHRKIIIKYEASPALPQENVMDQAPSKKRSKWKETGVIELSLSKDGERLIYEQRPVSLANSAVSNYRNRLTFRRKTLQDIDAIEPAQ